MALDSDKLENPFSKLAKSLKKLPKQPSPKQVHNIRTRTRRVEAALHALLLDKKQVGQRSTKALTPIRKRAGKVRDMDVLTGFASTLSSNSHRECLVQLLEHLGHQRFQRARRLRKTVSRQRNVATRELRRCLTSIKHSLNRKKGRDQWPMRPASLCSCPAS